MSQSHGHGRDHNQKKSSRRGTLFFRWIRTTALLSDKQKLAYYPPFLFMGARITELSSDYRTLRVKLPLRWYAKNHYGTMFGGFMASLADPLPALMVEKQFPGAEVWTKKMTIEFNKPGHSDLELRLEFTDTLLNQIKNDLEKTGVSQPVFHFSYYNAAGTAVANIENTVFVRLKRKQISHRKTDLNDNAENQSLPLKTKLAGVLQELGSEAALFKIVRTFYEQLSQDILLLHFFADKDLEHISKRQTDFLLRAMGARTSYEGNPPALAHGNLPSILSGHFDRRLKILEEVLKQAHLSEASIAAWIQFEDSFRHNIVVPEGTPNAKP